MTPKQEEQEALRKQRHMEKMARAAAEKREKDAKKARWARMKEIRREIADLDREIAARARKYDKAITTKEMVGVEGLQGLMLRDSQRKRALEDELKELMG